MNRKRGIATSVSGPRARAMVRVLRQARNARTHEEGRGGVATTDRRLPGTRSTAAVAVPTLAACPTCPAACTRPPGRELGRRRRLVELPVPGPGPLQSPARACEWWGVRGPL